jgi:hypothetical protein
LQDLSGSKNRRFDADDHKPIQRYESVWRNFIGAYRPLVEECAFYDNAGSKLQLLDKGAKP